MKGIPQKILNFPIKTHTENSDIEHLTMEYIENKYNNAFKIEDKYSVNVDVYNLYTHKPHVFDINKDLLKKIFQTYLLDDDNEIIASTLRCITLVFENSAPHECPFTNSEILNIIFEHTTEKYFEKQLILHEAIRLAAVCTKNKQFVDEMDENVCIKLFWDISSKINNDSMISLSLNAISNIIYYKDIANNTIMELLQGTNEIIRKIYHNNENYHHHALFSLLHITKVILEHYNPNYEISELKIIQFLPNFLELDSQSIIRECIRLCDLLYQKGLDIDSDSILIICKFFIDKNSLFREESIKAISSYFLNFHDCLFALAEFPYDSEENSIFDFLYSSILEIINDGICKLSPFAISILHSILETDISILENDGDQIITCLQSVLPAINSAQIIIYALNIMRNLYFRNKNLGFLIQQDIIEYLLEGENDDVSQTALALMTELESINT